MKASSQLRPPAVADLFYPADPDALAGMVDEALDAAAPSPLHPAALIAPHAGYIYSGPIAGCAFARLRHPSSSFLNAVIIGPSHRVGFRGIALSDAMGFATPLGVMPVDTTYNADLLALSQVEVFPEAHRLEHAIEVELPFLQRTLGDVPIVPLVVGDATAGEVAEVLSVCWRGDHTLLVVSSDLSHYLSYAEAVNLDRRTADAIESLDAEAIGADQACGRIPIQGLLQVARARNLVATTLDLRNSGDTAGDHSRVVGYGAFAFTHA